MSLFLRFLVREAKSSQKIPVQLQQQRTVKKWLAPVLQSFRKRKEKLPEVPIKRNTFLEWNYGAELFAFSNRLGEQIPSPLLQEAMTHADYVKRQQEEQAKLGLTTEQQEAESSSVTTAAHNASLAQEGAEIASQYILSYLRKVLPKLPEDGIRAIHDFLLTEDTLAHISRLIGTKDLILSADEPEPSPATLARTLLAVIGAVGQSSGEERACVFVRDLVLTQLAERDVADLWMPADPWAALQGVLERDGRAPPEPRQAYVAGVGTLLEVQTVVIYSDKKQIGKGAGQTLLEARNIAAMDALRRIFGITDSMSPFPLTNETAPDLSDLQAAGNIPHQPLEHWSTAKLPNVVQSR